MRAEPSSVCCSPGTGCCGGSPNSIIDYIERGFHRRREPPCPIVGEVRRDHEGRTAQFSLRLDGSLIQSVTFRVSSCVTLMVYCEFLAEWVTGLTTEAAGRFRPAQLMAALPLVPPYKRIRAVLATAALLSAIQESNPGEPQ